MTIFTFDVTFGATWYVLVLLRRRRRLGVADFGFGS